MDFGISSGKSFDYIQQPRLDFAHVQFKQAGTSTQYSFEQQLSIIASGLALDFFVTNVHYGAEREQGWITHVAGNEMAAKVLRQALRTTTIFLSLTPDQWAIMYENIMDYGGFQSLPYQLVVYPTADEYGVGGISMWDIAQYMIEDILGLSAVMAIPNYWARQFICRDTQTIASFIKSLTDLYDPLFFVIDDTFIIADKTSYSNYEGYISIDNARMVDDGAEFRPIPDKFVVEGSHEGEYNPDRFTGQSIIDIQTHTIRMFVPLLNNLDDQSSWELTDINIQWQGGERLVVPSVSQSDSVVPGTSIKQYQIEQSEYWARDVNNKMWFSYYTVKYVYEYDPATLDYTKEVSKIAELRMFDHTAYQYSIPRLTSVLRNSSGTIWTYNPQSKNHLQIYKDMDLAEPLEVELFQYLYADASTAYMLSYQGYPTIKDQILLENYLRWTWLYSPHAFKNYESSGIPQPWREIDIRKADTTEVIEAADEKFMLSDNYFKSYMNLNSKMYKETSQRQYYNTFGLLSKESSLDQIKPGKPPRVPPVLRTMRLESISGEQGDPIMSSPADRVINQNLVSQDDVDIVLLYRENLAATYGDVVYEAEYPDLFKLKRGWAVQLNNIQGFGGDIIQPPSVRSTAWVEGFHVHYDRGEPGRGMGPNKFTKIRVEGTLN